MASVQGADSLALLHRGCEDEHVKDCQVLSHSSNGGRQVPMVGGIVGEDIHRLSQE